MHTHIYSVMNELDMQYSIHKKPKMLYVPLQHTITDRHTLIKITWSTQTPAANILLRENTTSLSSTGITPPGCLLKYSAYR